VAELAKLTINSQMAALTRDFVEAEHQELTENSAFLAVDQNGLPPSISRYMN